MTGLAARIAGAPITWGVCEVPGWGHQLAPERVLAEMSGVGLRATELGPDGFLPTDGIREALGRHGLRLVGGFFTALLHRRDAHADAVARAARYAGMLASNGADVLVLACPDDAEGYDSADRLDADGWDVLAEGVERVEAAAADHGLATAVHPHHGTVIQGPEDVERLLDRTTTPLCLDTGHLLVGGADPLDVVKAGPDRIAHVHLKDVDAEKARSVRTGGSTYTNAVRAGLYRPLGQGDLDVRGIVETLHGAGYAGWFVLEQDTVLNGPPEEGEGPVRDAAASLEYLRRVAADLHGEGSEDSGQEGRGTRAAHGATS